MQRLIRKLDQGRRVQDDMDLDLLEGADQTDDTKSCSEDLYYVLVEQTDGGAGLRVNSGDGRRLECVHAALPMARTNPGLAVTEKTPLLMQPTAVTHKHEIANELEKLSEQERIFGAHGDDYKFNAAFKVTPLRVLMICKRAVRVLRKRGESKARLNVRRPVF